MATDWADKVRTAITNLETRTGRMLGPDQALVLIDDIVEGKVTADELAVIHGIPPEWIKTTLAQITRAVGTGRVRSLEAGGWYVFQGYEHPYRVAPGFAVAWKTARSAVRQDQSAPRETPEILPHKPTLEQETPVVTVA